MIKKLTKRVWSLLLALTLLLGNFPAVVFATEETPAPTEMVAEETVAPTEAAAEETSAATEAPAAEETIAPTEAPAPEVTVAPTEATEEAALDNAPEMEKISEFAGDEAVLSLAASQLSSTVEQQIRAYATSINKPNADDDAAWALAKHGMFNRSALHAGKSHPLTATLMNAEASIKGLTIACVGAIDSMQKLSLSTVAVKGNLDWYKQECRYFFRVYGNEQFELDEMLFNTQEQSFATSIYNQYDSSLTWITGNNSVKVYFERKSVTNNNATYAVKVVFTDRFDFRENNGSVPADIASLIGSALFREFDWDATAEFELAVPYTCAHSTADYHWTYDADNVDMLSVTTDGFKENQATKHAYTREDGKTQHYFELNHAVTLRHDLPWVLEYTVKKPGKFAIAPTGVAQSGYPHLWIQFRTHFFLQRYEWLDSAFRIHCYGYTFADLFAYSSKQTYTIHLENVINPDGGNMIYVSVYNHDLQKTVLKESPMDDYYWNEAGVLTLQNKESKNLSGIDLKINYIGNKVYGFAADYFDLKIWENGKDGETKSCFASKVTKPTCTAKGYTTHTCALCGYSYKDSYQAALGHSYGDWTLKSAPTCTAQGEEYRRCSTCKKDEVRYIDALGHDILSHTGQQPTCTEDGWGDYETCNRCSHSTYQSLPSKGHPYSSEATAPTCTVGGYTAYTCTVCSFSYVDGVTDALGHTEVIHEAVAPTCTETGLTEGRHCSACEEILAEQQVVDALGHDLGDWSITEESTCIEDGEKHRNCSRCDYTETESIPADGHSYEDVVTYPTCTEDGYTTHTCAACGDTCTDTPVEALGHDYIAEVVEPTYTKQGYTVHQCSRCEDFRQNTYVDALGLPKPVVTVSNGKTGSGILSWADDGEADFYEIYRAASKNGKYKLLTTVTENEANVSIGVGKTYFYKVKAICDEDASLSSNDSSAVKVTGKCAQPEITVEANAAGKPVIKWSKISGAKKYEVYRAASEDGKYKKVKTITSVSYTDKTAELGDTYYYKVKAVASKSAFNSAFSEIRSCLTICAQPTVTAKIVAVTGKPVLNWKAVTGATSYEIYRAENDGAFVLITTQTELSYTDENTVADGKYSYQVKAIAKNSALNSAESTSVTVTATCAKPAANITLNGKKPMISWEPVEGATKYYVYRSTKKGNGYKKVATVEEGESYTDSKAKKGTTYYYKVVAVSENTSSAFSNVVKIKSK